MRVAAGPGAFALAVVIGVQSGCGLLEPKAQRQLSVFACRVAAVSPYVGEVFEAEDLVRDALTGKADIVQTLVGLGSTRAEVSAAAAAWNACRPPQPAPQIDPSKLTRN